MNAKLIMLMETVRAFIKREDGASAIEYALIAGLISIVVIGGASVIGGDLATIMDKIQDAVGLGAGEVGG